MTAAAVDPDLKAILACPKCKTQSLEWREAAVRCLKCRLEYAVEDGIPVMLVEEAKPFDP